MAHLKERRKQSSPQAQEQEGERAQACRSLALAFVSAQRFDEALEQAQSAVDIQPDNGENWLMLAIANERAGHYQASLEASLRAQTLMPESSLPLLRIGIALSRMERHEQAIAAYRAALSKKPVLPDACDNLAQTYRLLNRLEEAEVAYRLAILADGQALEDAGKWPKDETEFGARHFHLALLEMLRGKYIRGFDRYRARFKEIGGCQRPRLSKPLWRGEALDGKTILVHHEQGFGDTLMMCRYLPLLKARGARVAMAVLPPMLDLFKGWPGADEVIAFSPNAETFANVESALTYDCAAAFFDLPYHFGTTLENIPNAMPYLPLPPVTPETALTDEDKRPKIGVVWTGNPTLLNARRSMPLELFSKLFEETKARFYNFTRDLKAGEDQALARYPITDLRGKLHTFADSARFLQQMDLVIACDTATAHMAAGMGLPVWTFLQFSPAWIWGLDRLDCPWYPTMRLFRQDKPGDWQGVVTRLNQALQAYVSEVRRPFYKN